MPEETSTAGGQAPTSSQPQAGTPQTAPQAGDGEQPPKPSMSLEQALRELEAARKESAERRVKLRELETKNEEYERAKLSELEKAQKDAAKHQQTATEWQQRHQELLVKMSIKDQARDLGFHDPEDAYIYLMRSGELEYEDDGQPKNAAKLLDKLAKDKSYLVKNGNASPGTPQASRIPSTNPSRSATTPEINEAWVRSLSPNDYANLSSEQRAAIRQWNAERTARQRRQ